MKPLTKQTVKTASKFVTIGLLIGLLIGAFIAYGQSPTSTFTISSGVYPGAPSYTIWNEGSDYFAKDANGLLAYSGTNASQIINNALLSSNKVHIVSGSYFIDSSIQLPNTNLILEGEGRGTDILYSGSGSAMVQGSMSMGASYRLRDFQVRSSGSGLNGISLQGWFYGSVEGLWIGNFTHGILLDGTTYGCYFNDVSNNVIENCTYGIYLTGGDSQAANSNTFYNNRIHTTTYGIFGVSGTNIVQGNTFIKNDIEPYTICGINYSGDNSVFMNNWLEATAIQAFYLRGSGNQLLNNKYASVTGETALNYTIGSCHDIFEPNLGIFESQALLMVNVIVTTGLSQKSYNSTWWTGGSFTPNYIVACPRSNIGGRDFWVTADANEVVVNLNSTAAADYTFTVYIHK